MLEMKAVGKYIVISPKKEISVKTKGGLILDEKNREDIRYREAEVVNVGTDVNVISKGDKIYYDRTAGFNVEIKQKPYKVIKEFDVVIIL
jgi:co-chaperonin GroES (HSP10)